MRLVLVALLACAAMTTWPVDAQTPDNGTGVISPRADDRTYKIEGPSESGTPGLGMKLCPSGYRVLDIRSVPAAADKGASREWTIRCL